jgi:murein DD-endopeptidase MepM/ murein hydrolase activator NlpD
VVLVAVLILVFITWGISLRRAVLYDRMSKENAVLRAGVEKLSELQAILEEMQIVDSQLRSALGARPGLTMEDRALLRERYRNRPSTPGGGDEPFDLTTQPVLLPVTGLVTRTFSDDPLAGTGAHRGIDFAVATGAPIIAAASGKVLFSGWTQQYGYTLIVGHASNYSTFYGHAQALFYRAGDDVKQGEPVGLVGNTGVSTAPHLHYEVWKNGVPINPFTLINETPTMANRN